MKRSILFSLFLLLSIFAWSQPPNGKNQQSPQSNTTIENGIPQIKMESNGLFNTTIEKSTNQQVLTDSTFLHEEERNRKEQKMDLNRDTELNKVEQTNQIFLYFSKIRQYSKLNPSQRTPLPSEQQEMDKKVKELAAISPESWQYQLADYQSSNYDLSRKSSIERAYQQMPVNADVLKYYLTVPYFEGDTLATTNTLSTLYTNQFITHDAVAYTSDVLSSCAMNATLITHGYEDSYGVLVNQFMHRQREDITLISLDFLQSPQYRSLLESKGYELPKSTKIDVNFLNHFCDLNAEKQIYLSLTIPRNYFEPISKKLYSSGLTFQYAEMVPNDLPLRQEQLWFYDLHKNGLNENESRNKFAMNYLPMLFFLKEKYQVENNSEKLQAIQLEIDKILGNQGKKE